MREWVSLLVPFSVKTPYEILGLEPGCSDSEIKKAYRLIAARTHPDRNPGNKESEDKFKEATRAYELLSDPAKKAEHDSSRRDPSGGIDFMKDFMNEFLDPFSGRAKDRARKAQRNYPGNDSNVSVNISFTESMFGTTREIKAGRPGGCPHCGGSGSKPGSRAITCASCSGSGNVPEFMSGMKRCPSCKGKGANSSPCKECNGTGSGGTTNILKVIIPAGVSHGQILRVPGMGEDGDPPGDLFVSVSVPYSDASGLKRTGQSLWMSSKVPMMTLIKGGTHEIASPFNETVVLNVSPGTSSGTELSLLEKGFPNPSGSGRGSIIVRLDAYLPTSLTPKAEELMNELMKEFSQISQ